jgi:hypothetical protein
MPVFFELEAELQLREKERERIETKDSVYTKDVINPMYLELEGGE